MNIFKPKPFTAKWFAARMREGTNGVYLPRADKKYVEHTIEKASVGAETAYKLGRKDAAEKHHKRDIEKLMNCRKELKNYPFKDVIVAAYRAGYDTWEGGNIK